MLEDKLEKLKNAYIDIKLYMQGLRNGTINGKVGAIIYVEKN